MALHVHEACVDCKSAEKLLILLVIDSEKEISRKFNWILVIPIHIYGHVAISRITFDDLHRTFEKDCSPFFIFVFEFGIVCPYDVKIGPIKNL